MRRKGFSLNLLVALCVAVAAALAGAQGAPTYVYDISQHGERIGQTTLTVVRTPEGTTARSTLIFAGLFEAENELVARPDGTAISYQIGGLFRGSEMLLVVVLDENGAALSLTQASGVQSATMSSEQPYYVFDTNVLDGFQIAVDQVMASGAGRAFHGLMPQNLIEASFVFNDPQPTQIEFGGETIDATVITVALDMAGELLELTITVDDEGNILTFEQLQGMVRFVRRPEQEQVLERTEGVHSGESQSTSGVAEGSSGANESPDGAVDTATAEGALEANAHCVAHEAVRIVSTGEILHGQLTLPISATDGGGPPVPALLLLPGSGAVDMDGNAPPFVTNMGYRQLAFELACRGYGVLRVAKLGIEPSTGDANAVTLQTYASNVADWFELLTHVPGVDASKLGIIGHSEGGLIALYAVANGYVSPAVVVLAAAPGRPMDVLLREQLIASLQRGGVGEAHLDEWVRHIDQALEAIRHSEGTALAVEGELAGNLIVGSFAHAAGLLRSEFEQDPVDLAAQVTVPSLVLQGLKDMQVLQVDGRNLAGALPNGTLLELPNLSHQLVHVPGAPESGIVPAYDAVLSGTFVQALVTWLHGHLRTAR